MIAYLFALQCYNRQASDSKQGVFAEQTVRRSAEGLEFAFGGIRSVIPWTAVLSSAQQDNARVPNQWTCCLVGTSPNWFDKDEHWDEVVEFFEHRLAASRDSDRITQIACEG